MRTARAKRITIGVVSVFVVAFVLGLFGGEAEAVILLATTNTNAQTDAVAPFPPTLLDLNGPAAGGTVLTFVTTAANTRVVIRFNAECAIAGATTNWLDVNILVNPAGPIGTVAVPPSDSDNALCSGNGTATVNDGWVSAMTQATMILPVAGIHTISVQVDPVPDTVWRIDDLSLIVETQ